MFKLIFLGILPIAIASIIFNNSFFIISENTGDSILANFYFRFLLFYFIMIILHLIIQLFKSIEEGEKAFKILTFSFVFVTFSCLFIYIIDEISQIDNPKVSIQSVRLNTKDIIAYSDEAIKFYNPNLTDEEMEIIKDEITFMEYLPVFLKFKKYKNNLNKKQQETDIAAYNKREQEKEEKQKQEARIEQERRQQLKKDFLSSKERI